MPKRLEKVTKVWGEGTQSNVQPELVKRGGFHSSLNFIASIDKFELLGGRLLTGTEETSNIGCLGLGSIQKQDGTWALYRKNATKLQHYNFTTDAWVDCKTGLVANEPLYFDNSYTPSGRQTWASGEDGLLKIYPSAPTDPIQLYDATKNYRGKLMIEKSRMFMIRMKEDPTGIRLSKIDKDSNYTNVSAEAITDTAIGKKHYTGTLSNDQVFGVVFTDGVYGLKDDKNGNLVGVTPGAGTGTINYSTGAYVLDFAYNTANPVTVSYLHEDPLTGGLADFTYSATRAAGEGNVLRQDATGTISQTVLTFNNTFYTLQDRGSWTLTINAKDDDFNNQVYNTMVSCASPVGAVAVKDGIIFIDSTEQDKPKLRKLGFNEIGDKVIPIELSDLFDLTGYVFDETPMIQFNDYIVFSGRTAESTSNNMTFIYSLLTKGITAATGGYNYFAKANGRLYGGDSTSPNVYDLFSGYDDLGDSVLGYVESGNDNLDTEQVKKIKKIYFEGYLSGTQAFDIYLSFDKDTYRYVGEITMADAVVSPGEETIGSVLHGDDLYGGSLLPIPAIWFKRAFRITTPKHERVMWKIVPKGTGYLAITQMKYSDIRVKGTKVLRKYKKVK